MGIDAITGVFHVVSNVNTAIDVLANLKDRKREWYG